MYTCLVGFKQWEEEEDQDKWANFLVHVPFLRPGTGDIIRQAYPADRELKKYTLYDDFTKQMINGRDLRI